MSNEDEQLNRSKVAAYLRAACVEPGQEGVSIQVQEDQIRAWCEQNLEGPYELTLYADEGWSGRQGWEGSPAPVPEGTPGQDRPALAKLVEAITAGEVDLVVVTRLDRLFRSIALWARFQAEVLAGRDVRVVFVSGEPDCAADAATQALTRKLLELTEELMRERCAACRKRRRR